MKFEKVSYSQFEKDFLNLYPNFNITESSINELKKNYEDIKLPERSTSGSAGYDFFIPFTVRIPKDCTLVIPTGIKCELDKDKVLLEMPRSGQGFKYSFMLANTIGVIDSDYYNNAKNEGHILMKMTNKGFCHEIEIMSFNEEDIFFRVPKNEDIRIEKGFGFCQGIIAKYYTVENDSASKTREGGFGSTDVK